MIQGCRYLRRSTDRWLLSKNSTTRLEGLESWHEAGLLWNYSIPITNTKGLYLYPASNTTPSRPRLQHLLPIINTMASCPSRTHHQFIPFFISNPRHHTFPNAFRFHPWKFFCRMTMYSRPQTPLANALRKTFCGMVLFYQIRLTCESLPCTNFWC
jgi:hypothetical protein